MLLGLPAWLPDETFFSLLSRSHQIFGHRVPAETGHLFFGHSRCGYQHDLPNGLREFCRRTNNALGTEAYITLNGTLLPFFLPHRPANTFQNALSLMCGDGKGALKYQLGLLTSRFRAHHPLKACLDCMRDDERIYGIAHWHLAHQFPGIWICQRHETLLLECTVKSNGVRRFDWILPERDLLVDTPSPLSAKPTLRRFADLVTNWVKLGQAGVLLSSEQLSAAYQDQVSGELRTLSDQELSNDFCRSVAPLRVIDELRAFPETPEQANLQIMRWVRHPRGSTHPLRHLALIFWLFETWDDFLHATKQAHVVQLQPTHATLETSETDSRRSRLQSLLTKGYSATAAAKRMEISVQTAICWASTAGIQIARRAKVLKGERLSELVADLRAGMDKAVAADRYEVSIQTITRILHSEVGLQSAWQSARSAIAQSRAREAWQQAQEQAPGRGTKAWRGRAPRAYAWLYRHDRAWLKAHSSPPKHKPQVQRVDWEARDEFLSRAVRAAGTAARQEDPDCALRVGRLCQMVPDLRAKLGRLARLPLTEQAILSFAKPRS
jgi:transposase